MTLAPVATLGLIPNVLPTALAAVTIIAIPLGAYAALRHQRGGDRSVTFLATILGAVPNFWLGILLIFLFSVTLGWLPSYGRGDTVRLGWWTTGFLTASGLKALILPSVTLGLFQMTLIMRLVRSEMLEALRSDYVKFARARGLGPRAINFGHALRNASVAGGFVYSDLPKCGITVTVTARNGDERAAREAALRLARFNAALDDPGRAVEVFSELYPYFEAQGAARGPVSRSALPRSRATNSTGASDSSRERASSQVSSRRICRRSWRSVRRRPATSWACASPAAKAHRTCASPASSATPAPQSACSTATANPRTATGATT